MAVKLRCFVWKALEVLLVFIIIGVLCIAGAIKILFQCIVDYD